MHYITTTTPPEIVFFDKGNKPYDTPWYHSNLIFIDTVWFDLPTSLIVSMKNGWKQKRESYLYFEKFTKAPNAHDVRMTFYPESGQRMNLNNPLNGLFRIEISAPNVLYGTNICAVKKEDLPELSEILNGFIAAETFGRHTIPHINDFKIKRVDFSFCIRCRDEDEADAFKDVFKKYYFKRLIPQTIHGKPYDPDKYRGSFYHSNECCNCMLYDKSEELKKSGKQVDDNILRFERQMTACGKKDYEKKNFGNFSSLATINYMFKKYAETDCMQYDFVPESTYYERINEQLKNSNMQKKTKEKLSSLFAEINADGAYAVHKKNASYFNRCRKITNYLSINIVHSLLGCTINFFKNICRDNDPDNYTVIDSVEISNQDDFIQAEKQPQNPSVYRKNSSEYRVKHPVYREKFPIYRELVPKMKKSFYTRI